VNKAGTEQQIAHWRVRPRAFRAALEAAGHPSFAALERWQIAYLPVYASWALLVVVVFPPAFGYR